jgi:hypothetical protein
LCNEAIEDYLENVFIRQATLEQAASKSQAEEFAQEVTHLRFKQQLELKVAKKLSFFVFSFCCQVPLLRL